MARIPFTKMTGAGNDFIVIDNRQKILDGDLGPFIRNVCRRRQAVGADGMLLLEPTDAPGTDFRMRYYNSDGGEAEMCGNGGRCIARFAHDVGAARSDMAFSTMAGIYRASVMPDNAVRLGMVDPAGIELQFDLQVEGHDFTASFANTGVPHVVVETADVENVPVTELGRAIRYHRKFSPAGTNADFVTVLDRSSLRVRTYERGVEDETLACGTGVTAVAVVLSLLKKIDLPVGIRVQGGDVLTVHGTVQNGTVTDLALEGPAETVFTGELDYPR